MIGAAVHAPIDFRDRVVVVTGGGGALGAAFSKELARRGAAVVVNDLGGDTTGQGAAADYADVVVREIEAAGGRALANYDTVATEAGGEAIIDAALSRFGRVDAVISNAGNQRNAGFGALSADDIDAVLAVHVKGAFFVCQPAYRAMLRQGYGRLLLIGSQSGVFGNPFRANYGAAKTAMIGLMNVIAQEAPAGIAVNCLFPNARGGRLGGTPLAERPDGAFLKAAGERSRHYADAMTPESVAAMACYLVSNACTTSQNMYSVLGGKFARIFIGLTQGWCQPGSEAPTSEDILAHLAAIDDCTRFDMPRSGLEEMDTVVAARLAQNGTREPRE